MQRISFFKICAGASWSLEIGTMFRVRSGIAHERLLAKKYSALPIQMSAPT